MIFFRYCFYFLISADPPIKYDIMSRLHPALLKLETLEKAKRRRQNYQFRKDHEEGKDDKGNTDGDGNKVLRLTKPYYVPTLSLKKYMQQKAGTKYEIRVQRARKMNEMRVQGSAKDPQKLPSVVSIMKNRFHGVKRNPENESGLSPLDINFKRHRRTNHIDNKKSRRYLIIFIFFICIYIILLACNLSCCV